MRVKVAQQVNVKVFDQVILKIVYLETQIDNYCESESFVLRNFCQSEKLIENLEESESESSKSHNKGKEARSLATARRPIRERWLPFRICLLVEINW